MASSLRGQSASDSARSGVGAERREPLHRSKRAGPSPSLSLPRQDAPGAPLRDPSAHAAAPSPSRSKIAVANVRNVGQASRNSRVKEWSFRQLITSLFDYYQVSGQITAIDRGHILWHQWLECVGVVPVKEMSAKSGQLF